MHVKDTKVHSYRREGGVGYSSRSEGHASVSQSMRASVDLPRHVQQSENILAKHGNCREVNASCNNSSKGS